jgi:hypothetical protein
VNIENLFVKLLVKCWTTRCYDKLESYIESQLTEANRQREELRAALLAARGIVKGIKIRPANWDDFMGQIDATLATTEQGK